MCIVYIPVLSTSGSDVLLDTDFGKVIDFANLICLHGEHKYNNSAKKFFFNDFPTVVKGLRSCWYVMFNYFLGYWNDKHFVKKNSVKPNIKADGTGSLRGRRREGGIWAREAREVSCLNSLPLSTATQLSGSGPVY